MAAIKEKIVTRSSNKKNVLSEEEFYANVSANIRENLESYLDGTEAHLKRESNRKKKKRSDVPKVEAPSEIDMSRFLVLRCTLCSVVFDQSSDLHEHIFECIESNKENSPPNKKKKVNKRRERSWLVTMSRDRGEKRHWKYGWRPQSNRVTKRARKH